MLSLKLILVQDLMHLTIRLNNVYISKKITNFAQHF